MLNKLARHSFFCYLDGYSGLFQISIHLSDQEKMNFTYPYCTFVCQRMPLVYAMPLLPSNIACLPFFSKYVKNIMEFFMDDLMEVHPRGKTRSLKSVKEV